MVISLRLRSGNSICKFMRSLADAGVGVERLQLVQLGLVMGRRRRVGWT